MVTRRTSWSLPCPQARSQERLAYDQNVSLLGSSSTSPDVDASSVVDETADGRVGKITRRLFVANVVAQSGIVVTGALVRLTGSGLGCPTWPECTDGSLVPVDRQAEGFHKYIEFGNRLLTFVLAVIVVACIVAAIRHRPRRRPLILLAFAGFVGIAAQAVLGGITVLTSLHPGTVAAHFLLSMVLIAAAVALHQRGVEDGDGLTRTLVRPELRLLSKCLVAVSAAVVILGTLVTGSGPHSGDADAVVRFGFDPRVISWLHADVVILFIGLTAALALGLRLTDAPVRAQRRVWVLLGVSLAQGLIGYVQYFTGLPELVVALHVAGACLVWIATLRVPYALRSREPADTATL